MVIERSTTHSGNNNNRAKMNLCNMIVAHGPALLTVSEFRIEQTLIRLVFVFSEFLNENFKYLQGENLYWGKFVLGNSPSLE